MNDTADRDSAGTADTGVLDPKTAAATPEQGRSLAAEPAPRLTHPMIPALTACT